MLVRDLLREWEAETGAIGAIGHQRHEQRLAQIIRHAAAVVDDIEALRAFENAAADDRAVFGTRAQR